MKLVLGVLSKLVSSAPSTLSMRRLKICPLVDSATYFLNDSNSEDTDASLRLSIFSSDIWAVLTMSQVTPGAHESVLFLLLC